MTLSEILYNLDPANTSCKENECYDEYDLFTNNIGVITVENLQHAFLNWFNVDLTEEKANQIIVEFECEIF